MSSEKNVSPLQKAKQRIENARQHTQGVMLMTLLARDKEELDNLKKAAKGMRGIKNLDFKIDGGRRIG